jgi:putative Mg2+ transporter-C (MgtC) family protein
MAVGAGAIVGIERTYFGRPAGFRTHALVATASSLLMLLTVFQFGQIPRTWLRAS